MTTPDAADTVARTIWGEARNQGPIGLHAVANVIMNRAAAGGWWGGDPATVCLFPFQFSCWNLHDPNRPRLLAVTDSDPQFRQALAFANRALAGTLADVTGGADSYYAAGTPRPAWAATAKFTRRIGGHVFFRTRP